MEPRDAFQAVLREVKKKIAGYDNVIELLFIGLIADGNVLMEGVPGLAKTTTAKTLAQVIDADFNRLQGTQDLQISDIVGYSYLDDNKVRRIVKGAIFTNILLLDELNRTPAQTTSGFLQALEERQATIGDQTFPLPAPFMAIATQNPLNIEGTMPLPKVLADRFLLRIPVTYASKEDEELMLRLKEQEINLKPQKVIGKEDILSMQRQVNTVTAPQDVIDYIIQIVGATRTDMHVVMGASPRAEISFLSCAKAKALIDGRTSVSKDDIKYLAKPVLSHRIVVRATGGIGVGGIVDGIMATLK